METVKPYHYRGVILAVVDGDTVKASIDLGFGIWLKSETFRLVGINAPELSDEKGKASREYLQKKISGQEVIIETVKDKKEKYGRFLARIIHEGVDINKDLVSNGLAVFKTY